MPALLEINLREFITKSVLHVFATMLSMRLDVLPPEEEIKFDGEKVAGSVNFVGAVTGVVHIHVSDVYAKSMTASMLGIKPEQVRSSSNIDDAIGELTNMLGGNLKSRLTDYGFKCVLSIPSVTRGKDFQIQTMEGTRKERFAFRFQQNSLLVELHIKEG
jgi:chemotaxis protein CheX